MRKLIFALLTLVILFSGTSCAAQPAAEAAGNYILLSAPSTDDLWETQVLDSCLPEESTVSEEDIELLALLTMAEAEGECEEGQRLVIDTVLNRVDSPHYPDSIYDVIWQRRHYTSMWNGRVDDCWVKEELVQLVREELESRTDYDVIFFPDQAVQRLRRPDVSGRGALLFKL